MLKRLDLIRILFGLFLFWTAILVRPQHFVDAQAVSPTTTTTDVGEEADSIQISPVFQEVILTADSAEQPVTIQLTNQSNSDQQFEISPVDIQQFDADGQIILSDKPLTNQNFTLSSFIDLKSKVVTIPRFQTVDIPLTIRNSLTLSPGGHYAAIVARMTSTSDQNQVLLPAISSFVLIRKEGGEQYHISLNKSELLDKLWWRIPETTQLRFANQGNVHVIPRGTIRIKDMFNRLVAKSIINENSLYVFPGSERIVPQTITTTTWILPVSVLFVDIAGTSQPGNVPYHQSGWLLYINPLTVLLLFMIIGAVIAKSYFRTRTKPAQPHVS